MKTSNRISNKKSDDPFDKLIFEKGLRAIHLLIDKRLDLLLVVLNDGKVLKIRISDFPRFKTATQAQLEKWKWTSKGTGVSWEELDEDISIKGMIKSAAINAAFQNLQGKEEGILL